MDHIPPEVAKEAEAIVRWVAPQVAKKGAGMLTAWRQKRRLQAAIADVIDTASSWPASRALSIVPQVHGSLSDDDTPGAVMESGEIILSIGLIWRAPFPARNVSLKLDAHLEWGNAPPLRPTVARYAVDDKVTGSNIGPQWLEPGSITFHKMKVRPIRPVQLWTDHHIPCNAARGRHGIALNIDTVSVTLFGPWSEEAQQRVTSTGLYVWLPCFCRDEFDRRQQ